MKNKITIHKDNIFIEIKSKCDIKELVDVAFKLFNNINTEEENNIIKSNVDKTFKIVKDNNKDDLLQEREDKQYIPGEVNLNNLNVEKAETKPFLVRCPHCGQCHTAILEVSNIENIILVRHDNEFKYVNTVTTEDLENLRFKEYMNIIDYFNDFQNFKYTEEEVVMDNISNIYCPMCDNYDSADHWIDAYNHPEKLFEYDKICDVCGGEMCQSIMEENGEEHFVCEKCHSEKIFKE
jgi:hypothetical protein